jgi:uncharacterized membrane protein YbhN (UPF0104 family)
VATSPDSGAGADRTRREAARATPASSSPPASAWTNRSKILLRILGLVALIVFFVRRDSLLGETQAVLARIDWNAYAIGVLCYVGGLAASTLRLRVLVRTTAVPIGFFRLFVDLIKATGLNALITPGMGEIYRVGRLRADGLRFAEASALVLADRALGLVVVGGTGLLGALALGAEWTGSAQRGWALGTLALLSIGLVVAAAVFWRPARKVWEETLAQLFRDRLVLASVFAYSIPTLFLWIASVAAFASALELGIPFLVIAFAAPLVTIATLIPISVGGIGVREAGYALLLAPYGVQTGEAIALGLVQYSGFLLVALVAWILLLLDSLDPRSSLPIAHESTKEVTSDV